MTIAHPAPVPTTRAERALELYRTHGRRIVRVSENVYRVPSQDGQRSYDVLYGEREECPCPDFEFGHGWACKHLLAVGIMHAARRGGVREIRTLEVAAGDPFKATGGRRLRNLEDRYHHELMDDDERQELRDRVLALRRRMTSLK
jgi:hypothetical protein